MSQSSWKTLDANEAVALIAYALNEVIAIYPITPASPMGEWADQWMAGGRKNLWGTIPSVVELQSEAGAAGTLHGAIQTGTLATTFTASQGLLLMIPNMHKIAGELTPAVFHVAARSLASHALSIFGDHSDVMAVRGAGWAMLCAANVQEAHDFALISQLATLETRIPFLHFFDGFRTSHEIAKIELIPENVMRSLVNERHIAAHRNRALTPDSPVLRGTAQNPDVYFQGREAGNPYYAACPDAVQHWMDRFAAQTGRHYRLFNYHGAPDADRVLVLLGSGGDTAHETVDGMIREGEKVGILKIRLYRPFDALAMARSLPASVRRIAVLDRTKESGCSGEPLYLDVLQAVTEFSPETRLVIGGRYGLSSKEFTPDMVRAVFANLAAETPKRRFVVGIKDDLSGHSLETQTGRHPESPAVFRALFYGLGSDGTVGANKDTIKIIGENTPHFAQGYFVYDSKKAGAITISHLRFGPEPIRSAYLIESANFIGCHQPLFLERMNIAERLAENGTLLLNTAIEPSQVFELLPSETQKDLAQKKARVYAIDAARVARECGMPGRVNVVMQVCFFSASGVLPRQEALSCIKDSIRKSYGRKGEEVVRMNLDAVDRALAHLHEVTVPTHGNESSETTNRPLPHGNPAGKLTIRAAMPEHAPPFVKNVLGPILAGRGDDLPVGAFPPDGTFPTGTAKWEKRSLAEFIPVWDPKVCIQCGKCVLVCPHAAIRSKTAAAAALTATPEGFLFTDARLPDWRGLKYCLQVAPEDCTGCGVCIDVCPARNKSEARLKAINLQPQAPRLQAERANWDYFLRLPNIDPGQIGTGSVREIQIAEPLFEFSGACAGCGETPYLKLLTQLFGDRLLVANATGCSSIYGGNLPTTPWSTNRHGRGPAWSNSLFEDNAEFGFGFLISWEKQRLMAAEILEELAPSLGTNLAHQLIHNQQADEPSIEMQRQGVRRLKEIIRQHLDVRGIEPLLISKLLRLEQLTNALVRKSVWIVGGDGWAYDIGFGGLDHVLASGKRIKVLVLDTGVYSNTGGQCSKATPRGAVAKFAAAGKPAPKKDLGLYAMSYGNVYVASVAMGAKDEQTLRAFVEAEAYPGPAIIIAYSHCIAHGIEMAHGLQNQKAAVRSGAWGLYRYDPGRLARGENPLQIDSSAPSQPMEEYFRMENRFRMLGKTHPEPAAQFLRQAQIDADDRWKFYQYLAAWHNERKQEPEAT